MSGRSLTQAADDLAAAVGKVEAAIIIDRATALARAGELGSSVAVRLNGPAQLPSGEAELRAPDLPALDRTLVAAPNFVTVKATKIRPAVLETLRCQDCDETFDRIRVRGRKPTRCSACR